MSIWVSGMSMLALCGCDKAEHSLDTAFIDTDADVDADADTDTDADTDADTDTGVDVTECEQREVLCVDDTPGPTQEYSDLQSAADAVMPGQTVAVFDGNYAGFDVTTSGIPSKRIVIRAATSGAASGAIIDADGPDGNGILLRNVSYVTVQGFTIENVSARGIAHREAEPTAPSKGLEIRNVTVKNTGGEGMYLSEVSEGLIEGNTISGSGVSGADLTHGIYLANAGSDGTTLRGNRIFKNGTAGIHFNGDLSIGGDGIISGLTVENNIIYSNGQNGLNMDGVQDSVVRNNLIYGNASNGIRAYAIDAAEGPKGLVIVNNTIHVPMEGGWCVRLTEDLGDNVVFNNVLMNDADFGGSIGLDNTSGFASANNAVVDRFTPDRDDTILSLLEWQALGYDAGSFVSTPYELFVNLSEEAYSLMPNSQAIDAGLTEFMKIPAPTVDLTGHLRDDTVDLGAYEFEP
jgi:hypothetical protein